MTQGKCKSFVVGLTGGIGSGKSTVTAWFRNHDIPVWDADAEVHNIYRSPEDPGFRKISERWPHVVVHQQLDRTLLRQIVVQDPKNDQWLKDTVAHSLALSRDEFMSRNVNAPIVVWDVPLLIESNLYQSVDTVMVIDVCPKIQLERIRKRNVWSEYEIQTMLAKQLDNDTRISYADVCISNNGTLDELYLQLESWYREC